MCYDGCEPLQPAQANNAYIFPAVGHAAVLTKAKAIPNEVSKQGLCPTHQQMAATSTAPVFCAHMHHRVPALVKNIKLNDLVVAFFIQVFLVAAEALSCMTSLDELAHGYLFPPFKQIRGVFAVRDAHELCAGPVPLWLCKCLALGTSISVCAC